MSFIDTILQKIDKLGTLEIRTIVGKFSWNEEKNRIDFQDGDVKTIITQINLVGGDITTAFSEDFLKEPYDKVREFHAEREKRGQEIIDGNIKALHALIDLILKANSSRKEVKEP